MSLFSTPSGEGQNRRKCEWQSNIEIEPRTKTFGRCTVGSRIGSDRRDRKMGQRLIRLSDLISITHLCLFLVTVNFNIQTKDITVGSHNLHQFKTASSYHKSCLQNYGGIWMAQELWLTEQQLPLLHQLEMQFVARSGMEESVSSGVFRGRPHGGVSIAWSNDLNHVIKPLSNYRHKRAVAIELQTLDTNIIFISVYMPFFDSNNRTSCLAETLKLYRWWN